MHPEADALLDAIFDHADDDTPRLVYADWLQEHCHEDYAQFIRLSVKADRGCRSLEERQQVRAERLPHWQRMMTFQPSGEKPIVQIHDYKRGLPIRVVVPAEVFVQTVTHWWPTITPPELAIYGMNGWENEVALLLGQYLPRLRKLRCDTRRAKEDHDLEYYPPLNGDLVAKLAAPGCLSKLESLTVRIACADFTALADLADSDLALQLEDLYMEVRFAQTDRYAVLGVREKMRPDTIRLAINSFLERHRPVPLTE